MKKIYKKIEYDLDDKYGDFGLPYYSNTIKQLHPEIDWFDTSEGDYQGEWFAVGKNKNNEWFFHQGSFGSCSGCDWLQSISSEEEVIEYIDAMDKITPIGSTPDEAIAYLTKTIDNTWYVGKEALKELIAFIKGEMNEFY